MATATATDPRQGGPVFEIMPSSKATLYERVSSVTFSILLHLGAIFFILAVITFASKIQFFPVRVPVVINEEPFGRGDHSPGVGRDMEAPGSEELLELAERQIAGSLDFASDIVPNMDFVAPEVTSAFVAMSVVPESTRPIRGTPSKGNGAMGDPRPPGPPSDGPRNIIPRFERWEIQYESSSVDAYAKQLDFFKIELGAVGGKKEVDYAFHLGNARPDTRSGPGNKENRFYVTWRTGRLKDFDRQLLARAGIQVQSRLMMQFYPKEVVQILTDLEQENAAGRKPPEYLKTVFGCRRVGSGFEYFIVEQRFRPAPPG